MKDKDQSWLLRVALLGTGALLAFAVLGYQAINRNGGDETTFITPTESFIEEDSDAAEASTLDDDGRFSGPGDEWPPVIRDTSERVPIDVGQYDEPEDEAEAAAEFDEAAPAAATDPTDLVVADSRVVEALGERYNLVAVDADEENGSAEYLFFSLSNNKTVLAIVENWEVASVETWPAGENQPSLSDAEKLAAIDLARAHWEANGDPRVANLEGFSILAIRPDNGNYHDTRVAYVMFMETIDDVPELITWVDLSNGTVLEYRVER